jgi:uncharacterized protein
MMQTSGVAALVHDLKVRLNAIATAFVSRDGSVLYADLPSGMFVETFAIMCATIVGAAATAAVELGRAAPDRVVIEGEDSVTVLIGSGRRALLVAVVERSAHLPGVFHEVADLANRLRVD